ncbi:MAG: hypothetical protein GY808_14070 [Gammaproteobacteria bacterium]|nr:hypothetical protein [Gammaproteobacteria bacterium]
MKTSPKLIIAIQQDEKPVDSNKQLSFSQKYGNEIIAAGHTIKKIDRFDSNIVKELIGCDGFIWRFFHAPDSRLHAKRLLFAIEQGIDIPVFPDWKTAWHYDDKIAQTYLLQAAKIPIPETNIFWQRDDAIAFCSETEYPIVLKLTIGASAQNVILINNFSEAENWIDKLFGAGLFNLSAPKGISRLNFINRVKDCIGLLWSGEHPNPGFWFDLQKNYFYAQEFLPENSYDTRITVIGNRAFGFRRFNRKGDFRASGSGNIDWSPEKIDLDFVKLAFRLQKRLSVQSIAVDGLYKNSRPVIVETSYAYASKAVYDCPGHWKLEGNADNGKLKWVEGHTWPEKIIMHNFIAKILEKKKR